MMNSVIHVTFIFCSAFLFLVMFISGAAKLIQRRAINSNEVTLQAYARNVSAFFFSKYFACIEIAISIVLLRMPATWGIACAAICLLVLLAGMLIEIKTKEISCHCFGSLSPATSLGRIGLRSSIAIAAVSLITISISSTNSDGTGTEMQNNIQIFAITLAFLYALSLLESGENKVQEKVATSNSPKKNQVSVMRQFDRGTILGVQSGAIKTLSEVAVPEQPLLVIFLSSNCEHCVELIPDLKGFIKGFAANLPIVLIANEAGSLFDDVAHLCAVLSDKDRSFFKQINAEASPFGVLLHGTELKQMAPIAYGSDRIRLLFSMTLNIR